MKTSTFVTVAAAGLASLLMAAPAAHAADRCEAADLDNISGKVVLPENCSYRRQIMITTSHTTLDCRNSTFIGSPGEKIGLMIDSKGKPLSDVTVKNCNFTQFDSSGVRVTWDKADSAKGDDHARIYERTPTGIVLDNINVKDNGGVGIYIDDYVTDTTIKNSSITGSRGVGIYLEHSSQRIKLLDNKIVGNGFRDGGKSRREGVAVDSSANNVIQGNLFKRNAAGGIFLYKNCGEHISDGKQVLRWQHSDRNVIKDNVFEGETVGVWLASRQGRNLSKWDCGDPPMNARGQYADYANNNKLEDNTFCRTATPVKDDGKGNQVDGSKNSCPAK